MPLQTSAAGGASVGPVAAGATVGAGRARGGRLLERQRRENREDRIRGSACAASLVNARPLKEVVGNSLLICSQRWMPSAPTV